MKGMRRAAIIVTAVVSIAVAVIGLLYSIYAIWRVDSGDSSGLFKTQLFEFNVIFHLMALVCMCFYVLLLRFGIAFLRGRVDRLNMFTTVLICEIGYWLITYAPWRIITFGWSAAAIRALINGGFPLEWSGTVGMATMIANAGLVVQFDILFPLWGPLVMWWATRSGNKTTVPSKSS